MEIKNYGKLMNRVKAVFIDSLVYAGLGISMSAIFNKLEGAPDVARLIAFLVVFILYDPIFTSLAGGTIGHLLIGLRVRKGSDESKKIMFPLAVLRFLIKVLLGWISLLTITGNAKNKAIHDSAVNSVVIEL